MSEQKLGIVYRIRFYRWVIWHTRPGHTPHGVITTRHAVYCGACGSTAPMPRRSRGERARQQS